MFDLECLSRYNKMRLTLWLQLKQQHDTIANAKPCNRALLKARIKSIQPAIHASQQVAQLAAKSDSFACRLCSMARYLQRMGELPENNQGKGATHATHLNNPEVASAVRSWVNGLVPVGEGGFEGRVSVALALLSLITQLIVLLIRCVRANYADMSINFSSLNYRLRIQSARLLLSAG